MKILKVPIKKQRSPNHCHFEYPGEWDAKKIHVLVYEDHPDNLGHVEEVCVCVTDDETAGKLLKHPGVQEVTVDEANLLGRKWKPSRVTITDENRIIVIIRKLLSKETAKVTLKTYLAQDEIDSLDEEKQVAGIERKREFDINEFI